MNMPKIIQLGFLRERLRSYRKRSLLSLVATSLLSAIVAFGVFYSTLVATSTPLDGREAFAVERAIWVLEAKGFEREALLLRSTATFRRSDNWLNGLIVKENSYAATNFPVQIITLYPDFFRKTVDNTERAMVLLHEAQHLKGGDEAAAYAYVWENRAALGWTQLSHGTTPTYVTIQEQTRENAPQLFTCRSKVWNDCTETLQANAQLTVHD